MPYGNTMEKAQQRFKLVRLVLFTMLAIAFGFIEEYGDPFGLDSFSEEISANIFTTIVSPFYGKKADNISFYEGDGSDKSEQTFRTRYGQSEIVVVLIGEDYAQSPPPPNKYRRLLRRLDAADAKAALLDIYFDQNTPQESRALAKLIEMANELKTTRVVFGGVLNDPVPHVKLSDQKTVKANLSALIEWEQSSGFYKLAVCTQADGTDCKLENSDQIDAAQLTPTAALKLYEIWCEGEKNKCPQELKPGAKAHDDLYLQWGYAPNEMMTDSPALAGYRCRGQDYLGGSRLAQSLSVTAINAVKGFKEEESLNTQCIEDCICPYHTQISLRNLYRLSEQDLRDLVGGKIVLIGISMPLYPDLILSPVHGYIPGIFKHAMALDNLIELESSYLKDTDGEIGDAVEFLSLAFILMLQAWITWQIEVYREKYTGDSHVIEKMYFCKLVFSILVIAIVIWYFSGFREWAPSNWIGLAALMLLVGYSSSEQLPKRIWQAHIFTALKLQRYINGKKLFSPLFIIEHPTLSAINSVLGSVLLLTLITLAGFLVIAFPQTLLLASDAQSRATVVWGVLLAFVLVLALSIYGIEYYKKRIDKSSEPLEEL